jgi:uncharacterized protein with GYD domain
MPTYLFKVSYSQEGIQGILKQGAANRAAQIGEITAANGGSVEGFYFAFGETDAYVTVDLPGDTTAAAIAMAVATSGAGSIETVKLLTPAEIDEARGIQTGYVAPGA